MGAVAQAGRRAELAAAIFSTKEPHAANRAALVLHGAHASELMHGSDSEDESGSSEAETEQVVDWLGDPSQAVQEGAAGEEDEEEDDDDEEEVEDFLADTGDEGEVPSAATEAPAAAPTQIRSSPRPEPSGRASKRSRRSGSGSGSAVTELVDTPEGSMSAPSEVDEAALAELGDRQRKLVDTLRKIPLFGEPRGGVGWVGVSGTGR